MFRVVFQTISVVSTETSDRPSVASQRAGKTRHIILYAIIILGAVFFMLPGTEYSATTITSPAAETRAEKFRVDPRRAYDYLVKICRIGPRISGTNGMAEQQKVLLEHFGQFDARIRFQSFDVAHPQTGQPVRMNNMIVSWHPDAKQRVVLACHYDTRPYADRNLIHKRATFIGANDGASGVALFMEMAHHMQNLSPTYGVDFVFFDGEELVYQPGDKYFLGSEYFSKDYRDNPPGYQYVYGVLVDMVADRRLNINMEKNSLKYAPELTRDIWQKAKELRVDEFTMSRPGRFEVQDDHLPMNEIARIPTCDIIDFDYPYWHTSKDVPSSCSGGSLAKVGRVLLHWLEDVPAPQPRNQ